MNPAHIHLLVTHLPIFGSILGSIVLALGIKANSQTAKVAAYYVLIISALGGVVAYVTGEEAEEVVEHIDGIAKEIIEVHEESAIWALICSVVLGLLSITGIYFIRRRPVLARKISVIVLLIALFSFIVTVRTGYLGGQIRHTEIMGK